MKRFMFTITTAALLLPFMTQAQMQKGNGILGLSTRIGLSGITSDASVSTTDLFSLGFSTIKTKSDADGFEEPDPDKLTTLTLQPKIGYFLVDNLAVGVDFSLSMLNYRSGSEDEEMKYKSSVLAAGPFVRYYFKGGKVTPYLEATALFGSVKNKYESDTEWMDDEEYTSKIHSFEGGFGIAIPVGNRSAFDLMAGYNSFTMKDKEENEDNTRNIIGSFGLRFGFVFFLGKDKSA
jgi:outer membrane protein